MVIYLLYQQFFKIDKKQGDTCMNLHDKKQEGSTSDSVGGLPLHKEILTNIILTDGTGREAQETGTRGAGRDVTWGGNCKEASVEIWGNQITPNEKI